MWRRNSVKKEACTPFGERNFRTDRSVRWSVAITSPGSPALVGSEWQNADEPCRNNWVSEGFGLRLEPPAFLYIDDTYLSVPARAAYQFGRILPRTMNTPDGLLLETVQRHHRHPGGSLSAKSVSITAIASAQRNKQLGTARETLPITFPRVLVRLAAVEPCRRPSAHWQRLRRFFALFLPRTGHWHEALPLGRERLPVWAAR